MGIRNLVS